MRRDLTIPVGINLREENLIDTDIREFKARKVEIDGELVVTISGRQDPIKGFHMTSENTRNKYPLEIVVTEGQVFKDVRDPGILYVPSGTMSISGVKEFDELKKFEGKEGELPIRDPDITEIDGRIFKQTGTLHLKVKNARILKGD